MISFDSLPQSIGNTVYKPGMYLGRIIKVEMKTPKKPGRPDYMSIQWELHKNDKKIGNFFDIMTEPENQYSQYKLRKFMEALGIMLPQFELRDLAKLIAGKTCMINISVTKDTQGNDQNQIQLFGSDPPYMTVPAANNSAVSASYPAEDDLPFTTGEDEPNPDYSAESY